MTQLALFGQETMVPSVPVTVPRPVPARPPAPIVHPSAFVSECGFYRYWLRRVWGPGPMLVWIMLNPSSGNQTKDDPTLRRCLSFARDWGHDGIHVVNLFAFRTPRPKELPAENDKAIGPLNDDYLRDAIGLGPIVCAWGNSGMTKRAWRAREVKALLRQHGAEVACMGLTKDGHPLHPRLLPKDATRQPFNLESP